MIVTEACEMRLPDHREAMILAANEYARFLDLLQDLAPDDWARPTDCTLWDVRAVVAHNLGNLEANASLRVMVHQLRVASKRAKATGNLMIDEMTALQVAERGDLTPTELVDKIEVIVRHTLKGRRRVPRFMRRWVRVQAPPPLGSMPLGYLIDTIYTRDVWMHRVNVCGATGHSLVFDADHDGRIVAAIVSDWASCHGQPFDLELDGPAGGHFRRGEGGESLRLDAGEFCRVVSGRGSTDVIGILAAKVIF